MIPKRDGGRGYLDATTDSDVIDAWWSRWPSANIGIACDARSGLLALDIDPRHGGDLELDALVSKHDALPDTVTQLTGGGGTHYVFQRPNAERFRSELAAGVEIKANGYVVAAPSVHPAGGVYRWEAMSRPGEVAIAELPLWVLARSVDCSPNSAATTEDVNDSLLALAFGHAGWLGRRLDDLRICVRCPWEREHTTESGDSATVVFAPRERSGRGWFHCSHAHCAGKRSLNDVLSALPWDAVRQAAHDMAVAAVDDQDVEGEAIVKEGAL